MLVTALLVTCSPLTTIACDDGSGSTVAEDEQGPDPASSESASVRASDGVASLRPLAALPAWAVSGPGAFDVASTTDGAVLALGRPRDEGGGVQVMTLDRRGVARESTALAGKARAREIAAAAHGGRIGVAWVDDSEDGPRVFAALGDLASLVFGPQEALGATAEDAHARGRLAVTAADGRVHVLHRGAEGPCVSGASDVCALFAVHALGRERRRVPLAVPAPCAPAVVGFASAPNHWHYALCADDGAPATTLYTLQFEPEYAHADQLLRGCLPEGLTPVPGGVVLTARCADGRRSVRVTDAGRSIEDLGVPDQVACHDGRPAVRMDRGALLALEGPVPSLAPLLPDALAPSGTRATWSGRALYLAIPDGERVRLRVLSCKGRHSGLVEVR